MVLAWVLFSFILMLPSPCLHADVKQRVSMCVTPNGQTVKHRQFVPV